MRPGLSVSKSVVFFFFFFFTKEFVQGLKQCMQWLITREVMSLDALHRAAICHLLIILLSYSLTCKNLCHLLIKINKNNETLPGMQTAVTEFYELLLQIYLYILFSYTCWASLLRKFEIWNAPNPRTFQVPTWWHRWKINHRGALFHAQNFKNIP